MIHERWCNDRVIIREAREYAEEMAAVHEGTWRVEDVRVAHMMGALRTRTRVCNVIRESGACGGLTAAQVERLLTAIMAVESMG